MKFLFSLIGTIMLLSPICTYGQTTKVGDINGDGKVTVSDLLALSQLILNDEEDENQPSAETGEAIDLGLPSGIKWASCNVGATKPEEYGGYYAWGETEEKETYSWATYIHCDGSSSTCHDLGSDISGTEYDVAHVKWGDNWRIPTKDEFTELYNNCTCDSTTLNGVHGMILLPDNWVQPDDVTFTPQQHNWTTNVYDATSWRTMEGAGAIFLPAAGNRILSNTTYSLVINNVGNAGHYWSASGHVYYPTYGYTPSQHAYRMGFFGSTGNPPQGYTSVECYWGLSVRLIRNL